MESLDNKQQEHPTLENDVGQDVEMTYEEFIIYSARLGEFDDVKFCIDEKVDPNT